ncbi:hypothetical protein [Mycobacterium sp. E740]|uniref:hypothetical protein n=1 Tax=Mycobacterium sp. E740 TaxID=1834149 RepID=UPI0007FE7B0E|nr:hypothetical protein [Mycobacterium sp. E740]OBI74875.1 hypothetical protein A5663_00545 [Mycobacterium sp. E740]
MPENERLRDDVPVADAVEQQRAASEPPSDDEEPAASAASPPMEVSPADWQEQMEAVELDADDDVVDQ